MDLAIVTGSAFSGPKGPMKVQTEDIYYFCGTLCRLQWAEANEVLQGGEDTTWFLDSDDKAIGYAELIPVIGDMPDYRVFCANEECEDLIHNGGSDDE